MPTIQEWRLGDGTRNRVELIFSFFPHLCYRVSARTWLGESFLLWLLAVSGISPDAVAGYHDRHEADDHRVGHG
jgi:hypothetical protein